MLFLSLFQDELNSQAYFTSDTAPPPVVFPQVMLSPSCAARSGTGIVVWAQWFLSVASSFSTLFLWSFTGHYGLQSLQEKYLLCHGEPPVLLTLLFPHSLLLCLSSISALS